MADMQMQIQQVVVSTDLAYVGVERGSRISDEWTVSTGLFGSVEVDGYDNALEVAAKLCADAHAVEELQQHARAEGDALRRKIADLCVEVGVS